MTLKSIFRKRILLIFTLLSGFAFTQCRTEAPCPHYEDRHYYISEEELKLIPYTGYDTLSFKRTDVLADSTDTIIYVGQGVKEYIENDIYGFGEHNCDGKLLKHSIYTDYVSLNSSQKFRWKVIPAIKNSTFFVETDNLELHGSFSRLKNPSSPAFFSTFTTENLTFDSVIVAENKPHIHKHRNYFNVDYGVIRMELKDSAIIYQLLPKK